MHSGCTFAANVKHTVDWEFALHSSFIRCATGLIIFFFFFVEMQRREGAECYRSLSREHF